MNKTDLIDITCLEIHSPERFQNLKNLNPTKKLKIESEDI
jgi:hypothetical protein